MLSNKSTGFPRRLGELESESMPDDGLMGDFLSFLDESVIESGTVKMSEPNIPINAPPLISMDFPAASFQKEVNAPEISTKKNVDQSSPAGVDHFPDCEVPAYPRPLKVAPAATRPAKVISSPSSANVVPSQSFTSGMGLSNVTKMLMTKKESDTIKNLYSPVQLPTSTPSQLPNKRNCNFFTINNRRKSPSLHVQKSFVNAPPQPVKEIAVYGQESLLHVQNSRTNFVNAATHPVKGIAMYGQESSLQESSLQESSLHMQNSRTNFVNAPRKPVKENTVYGQESILHVQNSRVNFVHTPNHPVKGIAMYGQESSLHVQDSHTNFVNAPPQLVKTNAVYGQECGALSTVLPTKVENGTSLFSLTKVENGISQPYPLLSYAGGLPDTNVPNTSFSTAPVCVDVRQPHSFESLTPWGQHGYQPPSIPPRIDEVDQYLVDKAPSHTLHHQYVQSESNMASAQQGPAQPVAALEEPTVADVSNEPSQDLEASGKQKSARSKESKIQFGDYEIVALAHGAYKRRRYGRLRWQYCCHHDRVRSACKQCGGTSICQHRRERSKCKECGGASICVHRRVRSQCKECGGASICVHRRQRSTCKSCEGSSICVHGRIRCHCRLCGGKAICMHGRNRYRCTVCKK